jgi:TolA-binding protein
MFFRFLPLCLVLATSVAFAETASQPANPLMPLYLRSSQELATCIDGGTAQITAAQKRIAELEKEVADLKKVDGSNP